MKVYYAPLFLRQLKKLEPTLQNEVIIKIEEFKKAKNHEALKTHKLHGKLSGEYAFSVNYSIRVRYVKKSAQEYWLLRVGPHPIYEQ